MFEIVDKFEKSIAHFYGAPYAVAVDSCTHAVELSLRVTDVKITNCPSHTYISIPFTLHKLNITWSFKDDQWHDYYYLGNTNIVDAAVYWKKDGYIPNTLMCLSFQFQKHLNLIKGGAILTDDYNTYITLKKMSYDGRLPNIPWKTQDIDMLGYHYYMTPETAQAGLDKLTLACNTNPRSWSYRDYPYLPNMKIFKNLNVPII
jgi:dTDP-4-amino-4,6-dideoxygalactose transaminase